ncbi:MAG: acetate--CoA ligase [Candidatus Heimdallarchaeota archaeon]|nr:acetate--CoA ligase [Candidatus Heimdallarchaeota archaeon]
MEVVTRMYTKYEETHKLSLEKPTEFWGKEAEKLHWYKKYEKVLDDTNYPFFRWFPGGKTNLCYNAVDRHALGSKRGTAALIWESPETGQSKVFTFYHLYKEVNKFAGVLKNLGVKKGDRIIIYMPMVPEAIIAMLASVRIGAIHSVVFAGFSRESLAGRIDDATPKLVLTCEAGSRMGKVVKLKGIVNDAIESATFKPNNIIVFNRGLDKDYPKHELDLDWQELLDTKSERYVEPEVMDSTDPSYILYTSGTTGVPKGIVRDTGGYMVALNSSMKQIYDCEPDRDVYFSTSDIGWVVGHSYIVYGPLLQGIPTVLYEGTPVYPNPDAWWRVIEKYGVTVVFSAPTALRILKKFPEKWMTNRDLSSLRYFFLAGEPLDVPTYEWTVQKFGTDISIIDHYWQTESGSPMLTNMPGIESLLIKPGSPTKAALGWDLLIIDDNGNELPPGEKGILVGRYPLPPGNLMTVFGDDERYKQTYWEVYPGRLFNTGDYAIRDEDGYFWVLGRADEVIKIAGHRLGTREIEEAVSSHPAVAETSCVGVEDPLKGTVVIAFVVLRQSFNTSDILRKEIIQVVRDKIGPIAAPKAVEVVKMLPKTRSGKIMRRILKGTYEGKSLGDLSTIEDGASIEEISSAINLMKDELGK